MRRFRLAAAAAVMLLAAASYACFSEAGDATGIVAGECTFDLEGPIVGQEQTIVAIRDFTFVPAEIHVKRGTRVTWVNCESDQALGHTSTSDTGLWGSDLLLPGESFTRVFDAAGTFPYHCTPHPSMQARVIVEE